MVEVVYMRLHVEYGHVRIFTRVEMYGIHIRMSYIGNVMIQSYVRHGCTFTRDGVSYRLPHTRWCVVSVTGVELTFQADALTLLVSFMVMQGYGRMTLGSTVACDMEHEWRTLRFCLMGSGIVYTWGTSWASCDFTCYYFIPCSLFFGYMLLYLFHLEF